MKRALPSYDDLVPELHFETEEGEIINKDAHEDVGVEHFSSEEDEDNVLGLKPVLPVGRYDETFKEGDEPSSGEQYLCTVRSQRSKLKRIFVCDAPASGIRLDDLCKRYGATDLGSLEVDGAWAELYWKCYKENARSVLAQFDLIENVNDNDDVLESLILNATDCYTKLYVTEEISPNLPLLKALLADQVLIEKLISFHKKWLESDSISASILAESDTLNKITTWMHALLMLRDSRLTSPEIALLRQLAVLLGSEKYRGVDSFREIVLIIVRKYAQNDLIKFI